MHNSCTCLPRIFVLKYLNTSLPAIPRERESALGATPWDRESERPSLGKIFYRLFTLELWALRESKREREQEREKERTEAGQRERDLPGRILKVHRESRLSAAREDKFRSFFLPSTETFSRASERTSLNSTG